MIAVLEVCFFIALFIFVVSQILIPGIKGLKMFPLFREESELKREIIELEQQMHDEEVRRTVEALQKKAKKMIKHPKGKF